MHDVVVDAVQHVIKVFADEELGDPFASGRAREAILADFLGHTLGVDLHGCDAYDDVGNLFEYKTTYAHIGLRGRYDVSSYPTWSKQVAYLKREKIGIYQYHYFATFTTRLDIQDVYRLSGDTVLDLLLPKFKKKYLCDKTSLKRRDLYATLSAREIMTHGQKCVRCRRRTI